MQKKIKLVLLWIKEFFLPCRLRKRLWDDQPFLICGHRGSPAKEPENTIRSFETALKEGANSLEFDLSITMDNEIVIWHDWNPDDTISILRENGLEPYVKFKPYFPPLFSEKRKPVRQLNLTEFRNNYNYLDKTTNESAGIGIPALEDFFKWSSDKKGIQYVFMDLKVPPQEKNLVKIFVEKLNDLVEKYKPSFKIVIETTFDEVLKELKLYKFNCPLCVDIEPPAGFIFLPRLHSAVKAAIKSDIAFALAIMPSKITIGNWMTHRRIIKYDVKRRIKFNGKYPDRKIEYLMSCTVNKPEQLECLVKTGIGGIQTDYPDMLKEIVSRVGRNH